MPVSVYWYRWHDKLFCHELSSATIPKGVTHCMIRACHSHIYMPCKKVDMTYARDKKVMLLHFGINVLFSYETELEQWWLRSKQTWHRNGNTYWDCNTIKGLLLFFTVIFFNNLVRLRWFLTGDSAALAPDKFRSETFISKHTLVASAQGLLSVHVLPRC